MNELENRNLQNYIIRKSVINLITKGAIAWLILVLIDYGIDWLPKVVVTINIEFVQTLFSNWFLPAVSWLHFSVNLFYGWLVLFITLTWVFNYAVVTQDSVVVHTGILSSREDVYQMQDIKFLFVEQGFWGKLFNVGTVTFYAYRAQHYVRLSGIDDPAKVAAEINEIHPGPDSVIFIPQGDKTKPA